MSEKEFLSSTPRKVGSLWKQHVKFNGWKFEGEDNNNVDDDRIYSMDDPKVSWFRFIG